MEEAAGRGGRREARIGGLLLLGVVVLGSLAALAALVFGVLAVRRGSRLAGGAVVFAGFVLGVLPLALVGYLLAAGAKPYRVPSEAMSPTLAVGDRFLTFPEHRRERGEIVVLQAPAGASEKACGARHAEDQPCPRPAGPPAVGVTYVKRVVALPGDRVAIEGGRAMVNGRPLEEPYAPFERGCALCELPRPIQVPAGHLFVLGDNRGASSDSRDWGPVPESSVVARATFRYWPPSRFGGL